MSIKGAHSIHELRRLAQTRVPRMFYDYVDTGSWTGSTYEANESDFQKIKFRQLVARDLSNRSIKTQMVGESVSMPVALAPTGFTGMMHADGEILACQAAQEFGVPFTLSTMSICSIEAVAEKVSKPFWFQLYVMKNHKFAKKLVERAKAANCSALVLTLDLQVLGQRHKDKKNGLTSPPKIRLSNVVDFMSKPRWCLNMLGTKNHTFGNIVGHADDVTDVSSLSAWVSEQFDPKLNWEDVSRIKDWWGGKLIIKGIMDKEDALLAVKSGADALVVSNHGGRQLDGTCSSISALPEIVDAVGKNIEVFMDGGIMSGQDVLKAVALGAKGTFIGRAFLYGLGAGGKDGVQASLKIIHQELDLTMALCGHRDIQNVSRDIIKSSPF